MLKQNNLEGIKENIDFYWNIVESRRIYLYKFIFFITGIWVFWPNTFSSFTMIGSLDLLR